MQAMASYWRSLLHSARAFGAQRPAAVLLGTAALSAGVWAASVRASMLWWSSRRACMHMCRVATVMHSCPCLAKRSPPC